MLCGALLVVLAVTSACQRDETVNAYGAADKVWQLQEIDDQPVTFSATLRFPEPGRLSGDAPCNSYQAPMTVPYPWFEVTQITATRRACPALAEETRYFTTLKAMSLSEVLGDTLILSTPEGRNMVFTAGG